MSLTISNNKVHPMCSKLRLCLQQHVMMAMTMSMSSTSSSSSSLNDSGLLAQCISNNCSQLLTQSYVTMMHESFEDLLGASDGMTMVNSLHNIMQLFHHNQNDLKDLVFDHCSTCLPRESHLVLKPTFLVLALCSINIMASAVPC